MIHQSFLQATSAFDLFLRRLAPTNRGTPGIPEIPGDGKRMALRKKSQETHGYPLVI